jgi:hypothetical protein
MREKQQMTPLSETAIVGNSVAASQNFPSSDFDPCEDDGESWRVLFGRHEAAHQSQSASLDLDDPATRERLYEQLVLKELQEYEDEKKDFVVPSVLTGGLLKYWEVRIIKNLMHMLIWK